jgi:hypothetical protein
MVIIRQNIRQNIVYQDFRNERFLFALLAEIPGIFAEFGREAFGKIARAAEAGLPGDFGNGKIGFHQKLSRFFKSDIPDEFIDRHSCEGDQFTVNTGLAHTQFLAELPGGKVMVAHVYFKGFDGPGQEDMIT